MLPAPKPARKRSARYPFLAPPWGDDHPALRRIEADLPADHHARWLACVVARLDLSAFRLSYAGYGSLAYPVEKLLAFVLFLDSQGVLSPAEWARRARHDDQCKWLLRGLLPSRSQLYTFRDRVEPFLDGWHKQLLAWALAQGVTTATLGSLDGTFVAALASRHQLLNDRRLDRRLLLLRLLVWLDGSPGSADRAWCLDDLPELALSAALLWLGLLHAALPAPGLLNALLGLLALLELLVPAGTLPGQPRLPAWVPRSVAGRRRVLRRYEEARQRLTQRLAPYQRKHKLSKKDLETMKRMKVSVTDPEAALGWDKGGTYRPLYNVLLVQASDAPLTLAWDVLARNNDDGLLKPMMEKTKEQLGRHLEGVLADGAFVSVGEAAWCEREQITLYAPPPKAETRQPEVVKEEGKNAEKAQPVEAEATQPEGSQAEGGAATQPEDSQAEGGAATQPGEPPGPARAGKQLPKTAFRYDSVEGAYYCPEGKRLPAAYRTTLKRQNGIELPMVVHQASGPDCQACPRRPGCTSNKGGRVIKRYEGEEALERLQRRMAEPASQQRYQLRGRTVELGYADLKQHRGLRVFRCFGRERARAQAGLVILASNGLNILRTLQRRQAAAQPHPPPQRQPA